jgi:hypothetical protein
MLSRNHIRAIFYINPLDYQVCEKYCGQKFDYRLAENKKLIIKCLTRYNANVYDLSENLPSNIFDWGHWPNEHVNETGKHYIAGVLQKAVIQHFNSAITRL